MGKQIKDIAPILCLALLIGVLVYIIDYLGASFIEYDFISLVVGGFIALIFYIPLAYLFKMNSLTELINIIKRK